MSTVEEIETAIGELPRDQLFRLITWIKDRYEIEWDRQIEADVKAGKLEQFAHEALSEYRAGRTSPFPPDEKVEQPVNTGFFISVFPRKSAGPQ